MQVAKTVYKDYQTKKSGEMYAYFYEHGIKLLRQDGVLSYITASLFLKGMKFVSLRTYLRNETSLIKYRIEGDAVFRNVGMPTLTIFLKKGNVSNWDFGDTANNHIITMMQHHPQLNDFTEIMRGIEIGRKQIDSFGKIEIITGSDVMRYIPRRKRFVSTETATEHSKDKRFFEGERILIRETGSQLTCLFLDRYVLSNRSLYTILIQKKEFSVKYVLGVLNSKIAQYYYEVMFKSQTELFPKIRIAQVRQLPIPLAPDEAQARVQSLVDEIISRKTYNKEADTSALEAEIDRIVYGLYGLTEEEIRIVEGE